MNEAEKCPVCRSDGRKERGREDGEYVAYYVCDTCMFMCGLEDLPRISAAMEYAMKTAYWFSLPDGIKHPDDARAEKAMTDAETRVLEVFK